MKKFITTPKDFGYDLWKSTDGKYFSRIKDTNEVCEIDLKTFQFLRNLEKQLRRDLLGVPIYGVKNGKSVVVKRDTVLSLTHTSKQEELQSVWHSNSTWYSDQTDVVNTTNLHLVEQAFRETLTQRQLDVYVKCLIQGMRPAEYARQNGISKRAVGYCIEAIQKKMKKIFE